eukprot:15180415-Alexandrium_andersonii.AAC.1
MAVQLLGIEHVDREARSVHVSLDAASARDANQHHHSVCCWQLPDGLTGSALRASVVEWAPQAELEYTLRALQTYPRHL